MRRAMSVNTSFPNSFIRKGKKEDEFLAVILNFMGVSNEDYKIGITTAGEYRKVFNSDKEEFSGSGRMNKKVIIVLEGPFLCKPYSVILIIPPFGILILRPVKK
jgi:1,4-alpha-glucan branching enzyme